MSEYSQPTSFRPLTWLGIFLIAVGLAHVPVWLIDGSDWEGAISWRKPILFGISTGMTLWSLGWLAGNLNRRWIDGIVSWVVSASLVLEVGLITMQQWRGTASHFNQATLFDRSVDGSMLILICVAFLGVVYFWIRSFGRLRLESDYALAVRAGLFFLIVSCLIGFLISSYGYDRVQAGLSAEVVGKAGLTKFPHGIAIHALQILPLAVFVMRRFKNTSRQRIAAVGCLTTSFVLQLAFASYQTWNGFSRTDLQTTTSVVLLAAAVVCMVIPVLIMQPRSRET